MFLSKSLPVILSGSDLFLQVFLSAVKVNSRLLPGRCASVTLIPMLHSAIGLGVFALGIVLLILGLGGSQMATRGLENLLSFLGGNSTVWIIVLGICAVAAGLTLAYRGVPRK